MIYELYRKYQLTASKDVRWEEKDIQKALQKKNQDEKIKGIEKYRDKILIVRSKRPG